MLQYSVPLTHFCNPATFTESYRAIRVQLINLLTFMLLGLVTNETYFKPVV